MPASIAIVSNCQQTFLASRRGGTCAYGGPNTTTSQRAFNILLCAGDPDQNAIHGWISSQLNAQCDIYLIFNTAFLQMG